MGSGGALRRLAPEAPSRARCVGGAGERRARAVAGVLSRMGGWGVKSFSGTHDTRVSAAARTGSMRVSGGDERRARAPLQNYIGLLRVLFENGFLV